MVVREGLFGLMGDASQGLDEALGRVGRARAPEWFAKDRRLIEDVFTLLDLVGWSADVEPRDIEVDLSTHGRRVREALECYLPSLEYREQEAAEEARGRARRGLPVRERERDTGELLAAGREFLAAVERRLGEVSE